jgi:beta-galactosidase GanA
MTSTTGSGGARSTGQEEIHGVLVGPDGTPVPFYNEVSQTAHEFARVESSFRDTTPVSQVALLFSYDSHWALQFQKHTQKYSDVELLNRGIELPLVRSCFGGNGGGLLPKSID